MKGSSRDSAYLKIAPASSGPGSERERQVAWVRDGGVLVTVLDARKTPEGFIVTAGFSVTSWGYVQPGGFSSRFAGTWTGSEWKLTPLGKRVY